MADIELKSFPFDSMKVLNEESGEMEDDRLYEAQIFRDYFRKFLSNGVYFGTYKNYGENSMKVSLDTGLTIKVAKGCGIIEGVDYENESDRLITLDRPASGNRVDRVVVQMNSSLDTRMSKLIVKQGTGTTPAELTRTDNIYEICLAEVTVKSTSNIADGDIVDTRLDTTLCGIVNSLISVNGEELYQRFQEYIRSIEENMMLKNEDIVDDLNSEDTDKALSAKQGKELSNLLSKKAPTFHASSSGQYGVGSGNVYGHCKIINSLLEGEYIPGEALAAVQGYKLNRKIYSLDGKIYDLRRKNIITAGLSARYTIENTGDNALPLDNIISQVGNILSLSGGKIVIGDGINHVKVNCQIYVNRSVSAGGAFNLNLTKNGTIIASVTNSGVEPGGNKSQGISEILLTVEEGDNIGFSFYGYEGDVVRYETGTYITVEVVD